MFRNFHKGIFKHRHKNATEKKHNSNLKREFCDVNPVVFREQQF